jgi:hypothetical protein
VTTGQLCQLHRPPQVSPPLVSGVNHTNHHWSMTPLTSGKCLIRPLSIVQSSVAEPHPVPHTVPHSDLVQYPNLVLHPVPHTVPHPNPVSHLIWFVIQIWFQKQKRILNWIWFNFWFCIQIQFCIRIQFPNRIWFNFRFRI